MAGETMVETMVNHRFTSQSGDLSIKMNGNLRHVKVSIWGFLSFFVQNPQVTTGFSTKLI